MLFVFINVMFFKASSKNPIPLSRFAQKLHLAMPSITTLLLSLMAQTDILNKAFLVLK
tara:strand:+ start:272 stop:445 length:174 start_codon:yes stop_codon:yes gene_type:complete